MAAVNIGSVMVIGRTVPDAVVSAVSGRDCSAVRLDRGGLLPASGAAADAAALLHPLDRRRGLLARSRPSPCRCQRGVADGARGADRGAGGAPDAALARAVVGAHPPPCAAAQQLFRFALSRLSGERSLPTRTRGDSPMTSRRGFPGHRRRDRNRLLQLRPARPRARARGRPHPARRRQRQDGQDHRRACALPLPRSRRAARRRCGVGPAAAGQGRRGGLHRDRQAPEGDGLPGGRHGSAVDQSLLVRPRPRPRRPDRQDPEREAGRALRRPSPTASPPSPRSPCRRPTSRCRSSRPR